MKEQIKNFGKLIVIFCLGTILIVICLILRAIMSKEDLSEMRKTPILRSLNNNYLKKTSCYHKWKWTGSCYCEECGGFIKGKFHGAPLFQYIKCGVLYDLELGFWHKESIQNFKFNETKIPHLIKIKGVEN